jgi:hypothetical protein
MNPKGNLIAPIPKTIRLLLRSSEAAAALSICPRLLWDLTKRGEICCVRIPGRGKARAIRYAVEDLENWIARQKGQTVRLPE